MILGDSPVVDQGVVVEEESAGDVEGHKHINAVVLMSSKDEEDTKATEDPGEGVEEIYSPGSVLGDEEIQHSASSCQPQTR